MKTLEEAATDYQTKIYEDVFEESSLSEQKLQCINDFKAGVAFAEEWISVEEELPVFDKNKLIKGEQELYLVKMSIGSISCKTTYKVSFLINDYRWNSESDWCYVTHWRPINKR